MFPLITAIGPVLASNVASPVVVIGSGIGGLSCACMLARYGTPVTVVESHEHAGGCAHSFEVQDFTFDSGPSLWAGLSQPSVNPLRQVLDAVGEADSIAWAEYDGWGMVLPDPADDFFFKTGDSASWDATLERLGGPEAKAQWQQLLAYAAPVIAASGATPPMVLRSDPWVLLPLLRCLPGLLSAAPHARFLNGPFSDLMDAAGITNKFLRGWLDYLAFALSGLDASGTLGAAVSFTLGDLHAPGAILDYPIGGSGAVIDALVRGLEKHGGTLRLRSHVEEILIDEASGRATGVRLRSGEQLKASSVVSNADAWNTVRLLPPKYRPAPRPRAGGALNAALPTTPSFMHLHLGLGNGKGALPEGVGIHYSVLLDGLDDIEAERNMVIISIPTLLDPSLAPEGKHVLHAYYAANEPWEAWEGVKRGSAEYRQLKEERAQRLWQAVERVIPDVRERVEVELIGSPLTHARFLRRHQGTYGPPLFAGSDGSTIPYAATPIPGLLHCGDSTFPGIGVPSAAASGVNAANTLVGPMQQIELINELDQGGFLTPPRAAPV